MRVEVNFFQGAMLSDQEFKEKFYSIKDQVENWSLVPLSQNILFNACQN